MYALQTKLSEEWNTCDWWDNDVRGWLAAVFTTHASATRAYDFMSKHFPNNLYRVVPVTINVKE